jgi:hypothetical protein
MKWFITCGALAVFILCCASAAFAADKNAATQISGEVANVRNVPGVTPRAAKKPRTPGVLKALECGIDEPDCVPNHIPGDPGGGGSCLKCIIGGDGRSHCKDPAIYTVASGDLLAPCSAITQCYWLGYWYCYATCEGGRCQSI